MSSPSQELAQKVCQKYGWSARFVKEKILVNENNDIAGNNNDETACWVCYVIVGLQDERRFVSGNSSDNSKEGMAAAAQVALEGLKEAIAVQEAKPKKELTEVFPLFKKKGSEQGSENKSKDKQLFSIKGSSSRNWDQFIWSKKPLVVGIDTEGNQSHPPVLVQIATEDCVLLEITSMNGNKLSDNLQRLLNDNGIIKVFCDNYAHHDKTSLGIFPKQSKASNDKDQPQQDFSRGPIVDLEVLSSIVLGPVKVARGLSRIVTLTMPELNVLIGKPPPAKGGRFKSIGRFTLIEQGKAPPLASIRDLSRREQHYAAVDAWATLQAYKRLQDILKEQGV